VNDYHQIFTIVTHFLSAVAFAILIVVQSVFLIERAQI